MAVLTCAEMVTQCLGGQDSGWRQFISEYIPFASELVDRHHPALAARREPLLREVLLRAQDQNAQFFRDYQGQSEREFLLHLREHVLQILEESEPAVPAPDGSLKWEVFVETLAALTALERQVVWMFVLRPASDDTGAILRIDQRTVEATMGKAQELRLADNRHTLIASARAGQTAECGPPKLFLRLLDGQITWKDRHDLEHHLTSCWHCVDRLCRLREVAYLWRRTLARLTGLKPGAA